MGLALLRIDGVNETEQYAAIEEAPVEDMDDLDITAVGTGKVGELASQIGRDDLALRHLEEVEREGRRDEATHAGREGGANQLRLAIEDGTIAWGGRYLSDLKIAGSGASCRFCIRTGAA